MTKTMKRRRKPARMPLAVPRQLNVRLRDGETGETVLAWLNGLPEVREVLAREFSGASINHVNLSAWRQGGYREWLEAQEIGESEPPLQDGPEYRKDYSTNGRIIRVAGRLSGYRQVTPRLVQPRRQRITDDEKHRTPNIKHRSERPVRKPKRQENRTGLSPRSLLAGEEPELRRARRRPGQCARIFGEFRVSSPRPLRIEGGRWVGILLLADLRFN